jgi:uncharacterized protein YaaQ
MKNIILLIAVLLTTSVNALTLTEAIQKFNGTEITSSGEMGFKTMSDTGLRFKSEDGRFDVLLDAGREARKSLAGCKFTIFSGANCRADVKAEISVKDNEIVLIVYEVNNLIRIKKK